MLTLTITVMVPSPQNAGLLPQSLSVLTQQVGLED